MTEIRKDYEDAITYLRKELLYFELEYNHTFVETPQTIIEDKLASYKQVCCLEQKRLLNYALEIDPNIDDERLVGVIDFIDSVCTNADSVANRLTKLDDLVELIDEEKKQAILKEIHNDIDIEGDFCEKLKPGTNYKKLHHTMVDSIFDPTKDYLQKFILIEKNDISSQSEEKIEEEAKADLSFFPDITPEEVEEVRKINEEIIDNKELLKEYIDYFSSIVSYTGDMISDLKDEKDFFGAKGYSYIEKCSTQARGLSEAYYETADLLNKQFELTPTKSDVTVYKVVLDALKILNEKNVVTGEKNHLLDTAMGFYDNEVEFRNSQSYELVLDRINEEYELLAKMDEEGTFKEDQEQMLAQLCDPNAIVVHPFKVISR